MGVARRPCLSSYSAASQVGQLGSRLLVLVGVRFALSDMAAMLLHCEP